MTASPPPLLALPLFPLGTVLFPGGLLPLRIFEVRYLDMIGRCHKAGLPFGVVGLTQGSEVRVPSAQAEQFASIGTTACTNRDRASGIITFDTDRSPSASCRGNRGGRRTTSGNDMTVNDDVTFEVSFTCHRKGVQCSGT